MHFILRTEILLKEYAGNVIVPNYSESSVDVIGDASEVKQLYETKFADPYIDHSMGNPPIKRLKSWMNENIVTIGNENKLKINIL